MLSTLTFALLFSSLVVASPHQKRSVTFLKVGATATAKWTNSAGKSCTWSGVVGSNFGTNSVNSGDYSCNGHCGAGCTGASVGNAYTQDCFSHDICSWFNNASGGASDANRGAAHSAAVDDTALGVIDECRQTRRTLRICVRAADATSVLMRRYERIKCEPYG